MKCAAFMDRSQKFWISDRGFGLNPTATRMTCPGISVLLNCLPQAGGFGLLNTGSFGRTGCSVWSGWKVLRSKNSCLDGTVTSVFGIVQDITERKLLEGRLVTMARTDVLTQLPNRACFQEKVAQELLRAKRNRSQCAILFA